MYKTIISRISIIAIFLLLPMALIACVDVSTPTNSYEEVFKGDWKRPGLHNKTGSKYLLPGNYKVSDDGMTLNVLDFGAVANDSTFDNYQVFKNAIASAADGDEIYVPSGNFYFKSYDVKNGFYSHITLKSNLQLRGAGLAKTTLISAFTEDNNIKYSTTVIAIINASKINVTDLSISSNTTDDQLPDPNSSSLQSNVFTGPKYGITIETVSITTQDEKAQNVLIQDVLVEKFQRMGVRLAKTQDVTVKNSTFQKGLNLGPGGAGYGVTIQGYGHGVDPLESVFDSLYNYIENCDFVGPYLRHGALIQYSSHNNLITNSRFSDILLDAIDLHGEDEFSNEISKNTIKNTRAGAAVGVGNTGATHAASGYNNFIYQNIIDGGARGIDVILNSPFTIIVENEIKNLTLSNSNGITLNGAPNTYVIGNTFNEIISEKQGHGIKINYTYNFEDPKLGIPDNFYIEKNSFTKVSRGVYIETHGENYTLKNNTFTNSQFYDTKDETKDFVLPEKDDSMNPVTGNEVFPMEMNFVTTESSMIQSQKNLKLKSSSLEPNYNRMIYVKFDNLNALTTNQRVYLSFTAKAQIGKPTINFWLNKEYTNWTTQNITWNNSELHLDTLAGVDQSILATTKFMDFTFPVSVYDFNTYYIDITDIYIGNGLDQDAFTLMLCDDAVQETYMEVYNHIQGSNQGFRLIYK